MSSELKPGFLKPGLADNYWNREIKKVEDFRNNMFNNSKSCVMNFGIYEPVYHPITPPPLPPEPVYEIQLTKDYLGNIDQKPLPDLELGNLEKEIENGMQSIIDNRIPEFTSKGPGFELPEQAPKPSLDYNSSSEKLPSLPKENIFKAAQDATRTLLDGIKSNPFLKLESGKPKIELAPVAFGSEKETVFKGMGNSHFSYENNKDFVGFHVTTPIPGIGKTEGFPNGLSLHTRIKIDKKDKSLNFLDID